MEDSMFVFRVIFNALTSFFTNGVWVVLFFFLLNKMYENKTFRTASSIITVVVLVFYLFYYIRNSM
ncbi:hypothetical protein [Bacillus toyonensis]|uniref:hypothetical protein n=1 Tax=Bacillus toyonensis TaxID=155322 RepID=UPI000BFD7F53|nr:hypothetical protein [Bacillus toyonensis]PHC10131.1 hypothetical protein COF03_28905 [Bacillus toyonensis]PHD96608.1 hypothetical protein COF43_22390 [Bacillus toyonensis]